MATGFKIPKKNILFSAGPLEAKLELLESAAILVKLGYRLQWRWQSYYVIRFHLLATRGTSEFLAANGIVAEPAHKLSSGNHPNVVDLISTGQIDLVIIISDGSKTQNASFLMFTIMYIYMCIPEDCFS
jgi:hypothetical protein